MKSNMDKYYNLLKFNNLIFLPVVNVQRKESHIFHEPLFNYDGFYKRYLGITKTYQFTRLSTIRQKESLFCTSPCQVVI